MTMSQTNMCHRLSALGVRQETTYQLIHIVNKWVSENGPEFTVNRLKDLKQWYIKDRLAGDDFTPKTWFAKRKDGSPSGPFGVLWKGTTYRHRVRALNVLMVYSTMIAPEVTPAQRRKFEDSVKAQVNPRMDHLCALFLPFVQEFVGQFSLKTKPRPIGINDLTLSKERRAPTKKGSVPEDDIEGWFDSSADSILIRHVMRNSPDMFSSPTRELILSRVRAMPDWDSAFSRVAGSIGFIQEPGFKLRAVANPNRLVQLALTPLQTVLWEALRNIPQDCTFDQSKGVKVVAKWIREGTTCHSIDLSDATNNFPFSLQLLLLRKLLPSSWDQYINLFEGASRAPWRYRYSDDQQIIWTKGQPLGLAPSFGSFALTHHMVVQEIISDLGASPDCYVILGDDIVISDNDVASLYLQRLKELDCPISTQKSITSDRVAEFAGKVITREGVITTGKWRNLSDHNFLDVMRAIGPQAMGLLQPRQRKIAKLLLEVPDFHGGLGFNPKGKTLAQRIAENQEIIARLEKEDTGKPVTRANTSIFQLAIKKGLTRTFTVLDTLLGTRDSRLEGHYRPGSEATQPRQRILEVLNLMDTVILDSEPLPSGYKPKVREADPRGTSTLRSYERKLKGLTRSDPDDMEL